MRISDWSSDVCSSDLDAEWHVLEPFATAGGGDDDVRGVGRGVGAFCGRGVCGTIVIGGRGTGLGGGGGGRDEQSNPRRGARQAGHNPSTWRAGLLEDGKSGRRRGGEEGVTKGRFRGGANTK